MSSVPRIPCSYPDRRSVTFVNAFDSPDPGPRLVYHLHSGHDWEVQYLAAGTAVVRVDSEAHHLAAGDVLIIHPEQAHNCDVWHGNRRTLSFRPSCLSSMPFETARDGGGDLWIDGRPLPTRITVPHEHRRTLEHTLLQLRNVSLGDGRLSQAACTALLAQFLLELTRATRPPDSGVSAGANTAARETVEQLCTELRNRLDYPWTLDEIVRRSGYSAPHLHRLFGQVTSLSPCRWLRRERVYAAAGLLSTTDKTMVEIAVDVGLEGRSQLHRAFREAMGLSPDQYRRRRRGGGRG